MIETFGEHSVEVSLLNKGICIDIGCRGFDFSKAMRDKGLEVWAFDLEEMEKVEGIFFQRKAVSNYNGLTIYNKNKDPQATNIVTTNEQDQIQVRCIDINHIYKVLSNDIDILKLDCEGSEYLILGDDKFKPIPKQISVEFHEHAFPELHKKYFDKCMDNLTKHYTAVKHIRDSQHGAGFNYWDSLFIRKDLC